MSWRGRVVRAGRTLETRFDRLKFGLKRRAGLIGPVEISPYRGHGTPQTLFIKGRVMEGKGITRSSADDTALTNLRNTIRRFASEEIPFARLRARFRGQEWEAVADEEGFFDLRLELETPLEADTGWRPVELELVSPCTYGVEPGARAVGKVLVPSGARFGVISDLDDTVIRSNVTSLLKMLRVVVFHNAHARLPFEGVASFYRALQKGVGGEFNPIFYLSNGPWNLYDLLEEFLDLRGVPAGPVFLRDWSLTTVKGRPDHKLRTIRRLLATYPELPFVLVGDSGERDPEIYQRAIQEHPGRIHAVYIRDVGPKERDAAVHAIAEEVRRAGVEMLLVPDTAAAVEHAVHTGLTTADLLSGVPGEGGE